LPAKAQKEKLKAPQSERDEGYKHISIYKKNSSFLIQLGGERRRPSINLSPEEATTNLTQGVLVNPKVLWLIKFK
jgi:hypothetical protein